jgi:multiple sugar transport system substrate-binding protein
MKNGGKIFLISAVALISLAACQGKGGQAQGTSAGNVTLKLSLWDPNQEPGISAVVKEFTEQTGIKVSVEVTPWGQYWTLLEAAATGGSLPDVFWMHSNQAQRYGSAAILMDLTDRIAKSSVADMDNFPGELVGLYRIDGKQYAIPKDLDTIGLWYNKMLFDEAGLSYPDENWTWDDLKAAARKLTDSAKGRYGMDFRPNDCQQGWGNYVYENNGFVISDDKKKSGFDDPKTIETLEWVVSFAKEGISPPLAITAENGGDSLLKSGLIAMSGFGSWMLSDFRNNEYVATHCDVVVLPKSPEGKRVSIYNGLGWAASAKTPYPEEAWKLLEFFSSEDTQRKLSETGAAISAFKGTEQPFVESFPGFNVQAYIDQIPNAVFRPYSKNTVVWEEMAYTSLNDAWTGNRPVADVCKDIALRMNEMLIKE